MATAFEHTGLAADLMHGLKYRGVTGYARVVADELGPRLPQLPLVPVPRVWTRYLRYGVDPSAELAVSLGRSMGSPVWPLLSRPLHTARRAGHNISRGAPAFALRRQVPTPVILVDDVVTTGVTLRAAVNALGRPNVGMVVAANDAFRPARVAFGSREGTRQP